METQAAAFANKGRSIHPKPRLNGLVDLQEYEWEMQARGWDDSEGERVCLECVVDAQLRANLAGMVEDVGDSCVGCRRFGPTVSGDAILGELLDAVHLIYSDALGFMPVEGGSFAFDTTDGREAIDGEFSGSVTDEVYAALRAYLRSDVALARDVDASDALGSMWERLRSTLRSSATATGLDAQFLGSFESLLSRNGQLLRLEPRGSRYWRVRALSSGTDLAEYDAARAMGAPPASLASASRFSAKGQSAFYGAPSASTSIAEVFQGTSGTAVKASFISARDLIFLDLVDLPAAPSVYDKSHTELFMVLRFLRQFAKDVSQPAIRTMSGFYLPTQKITQVVRSLTAPKVDGIRYTSSRDGLPSVVIFAEQGQCAEPGEVGRTTMLEYEPASFAQEAVL